MAATANLLPTQNFDDINVTPAELHTPGTNIIDSSIHLN